MAIAHQQSTRKASALISDTIAYGSNTLAGSLLICAFEWTSTTTTLSSVSDTQGNNWKQALLFAGTGRQMAIYYATPSSAAANTVTVTFSLATGWDVHVLEYTGLSTDENSVLVDTAQGAGTGTTPVTSTSGVSNSANSLFYAYADGATPGTETAGANYTGRLTATSTGLSEDDINTVPTTETAGCTFGNSVNWVIGLAVFTDVDPRKLVAAVQPELDVVATGGRNWTAPMAVRAQEDWTQLVILPVGIPAYTDVAFAHQWPIPPTTRYWEDERGSRIFIPTQVLDDDWQMARQPQMKLEEAEWTQFIVLPPFDPALVRDGEQFQPQWAPSVMVDDDRDYQGMIFLPVVAWDDDWQVLGLPVVKLEEIDSPLNLFLPPVDPIIVRDGEQIHQTWPAIHPGDDRSAIAVIILPPFDPTVVREGEWMGQAWPPTMRVDDERDYQAVIFLPPNPWIEDHLSAQRPQPARLSVEPEGVWMNLIVISIVPETPGQKVEFSRFRLHQGVKITRGF